MAKISFENLVKQILSEQLQGNTLRQQLEYVLNQSNYKLALNQTSAREKLNQLVNIAIGLYKTRPYTDKPLLIQNSAFLPIIDFLSSYVYPVDSTIVKSLDATINDPNLNKKQDFVTKLNSLANPDTYIYTDQTIIKLKDGAKRLAGMSYVNETPLNGILKAVKVVGGYNERDVMDIMKYPRKYEFQRTAKLQELQNIIKVSEALYFFYTDRIKTPDYIESVLKPNIPELQNKTNEEVEAIIDSSIGLQNPQNRALQADYEMFLDGKSKFLVQLVAESLNLKEANSNWADSAMSSFAPQKIKTLKPTQTPFIQKISDFSRQGYGGDINVKNAYDDFYVFLTKGTTPSGWQTAGKIFSGILQGLDDIGSAMGKL